MTHFLEAIRSAVEIAAVLVIGIGLPMGAGVVGGILVLVVR